MLHIINLLKEKSLFNLTILLILIIYWFTIWSSIGVEHNSILYLGNTILENINFLRINLSLLISLVSSFILLTILLLKIKKFNFFSIIFLFYLYFFFQLIGLIYNSDVDFTLGNIFLLLLGVGSANVFLFLKLFEYENYSKILLYLCICFCLMFMMFIIYSNASKLLEYLAFSTFYSVSLPSDRLFDNAYPKTTGLSRMMAVINITLIVFYLNLNIKNKKIIGFTTLIFITIFGSIIWGFQSRGTIISYFSALFIVIILFKNNNGLKIINLFLFLILPIIVFQSVSEISKNIYLEKNNLKNLEDIRFEILEDMEIENNEAYQDYKDKVEKIDKLKQFRGYANRFMKDKYITSGRLDIWKHALSNYDKKKIFGYGIQGDRYILHGKYKGYGNNSSNVFLYFLLSGGYFSLILVFFILLRIYYLSFKIYYFEKNNAIKNSFIFKVCLLFTIFFSVRGLVENSFGLFGVDYLFIITSFFIIENLLNKKISLNSLKII